MSSVPTLAAELAVDECPHARQAKVISENQAQLDKAHKQLTTCSEGDAQKLADEVRQLECRRSDEQSFHRLLCSKYLQAQRTQLEEDLGHSAIQLTTPADLSFIDPELSLHASRSVATSSAQLDEDPNVADRPVYTDGELW